MKFNQIAFIGLILTLALFLGCTQQNLIDENTSIPLKDIEIKDYNGQNLSSVNDFRENSINGPQRINENDYKLEVTGLVEEPKEYTYNEIINNFSNYKKVVTLNCVEGWSATILWKGFLVKDLVNNSKPLVNANTIIFHAYDGYTTSFPLEYIMQNDIIMASKMNDLKLPPERGFPFQLIAESKWGYKWIKWITKIELSDDVNYKGFWENRGYSNTGNLNENFFN